MRTKSPLVPAALAAAMSLVVSASSIAAGPSARTAPAPTPPRPAGAVEGFEDQAVSIPVALKTAPLSLAAAPANGLVVLDRGTPRYLPDADFSGSDSFVIQDAKGNSEAFNVMIRPVNDAPSFTGGSDLGHLAGTRGEFTVPGWARDISVGPVDEQSTQWLRFEVVEAAETSKVIRSAWVDEDGTLHYTLSGASGVGERVVRVVDSGGGEDTSKTHLLRIGVGRGTDLAIKREIAFSEVINPWGSYRLVVVNHGPLPVSAAQVTEVFDAGGEQYRWSCSGYGGGHCNADAGEGPVDATVALKVGGVVIFEVSSRDPLVPPGKRVAFVVPDPTMVDLNSANNELED